MIRVLRSWGRDPLEPLPLALRADEEGVHDLRVAARRFRTVLPLIVVDPRRARVRRALTFLRCLGEVAGTSRDFDVRFRLLSSSEGRGAAHRALLERLGRAREQAQRILAAGLRSLDLTRVQGTIDAVAAEEPERLFVVMVRFGQRRDDLAQDILGRLAHASRFRPDALHKLRIRVRRLRYLAEMHGEIRGLATAAPSLKSLQDILGELQDAWVLALWLGREAALARRRGESALAEYARLEKARWTGVARAHHRRFLAADARPLVLTAARALGGSRLGSTRPAAVRAPASHRPQR